ncbi:MAG: ribosome small subunit-dependent GTPase A [Ferrimicrobium sp.]
MNEPREIVSHAKVGPVDLCDYGWTTRLSGEFDALKRSDLVPARVTQIHRGYVMAMTTGGPVLCQLSSSTRSLKISPVTGDWVAVTEPVDGSSVLGEILLRQSQIVRRASGGPSIGQVLAANVDLIFIAVPLDQPISLEVLERYLVTANSSGASAVVLLTKSDCGSIGDALKQVSAISSDVVILPTSVERSFGFDAVSEAIGRGRTAVIIGPSGAGKSTIVNELCGETVVAAGGTQRDGTGRHTTVSRQLILLPQGGLLIDTPGLRELKLWHAEVGVEVVFQDLAERATLCRFSDCRHEVEPGCALLGAIAAGELAQERFDAWRKLSEESTRSTLAANERELAAERLAGWQARRSSQRTRTR